MPPKILEAPKLIKAKKNDDVEVTVKFSATPEPEAEWTVNGKVIKKTKKTIPTLKEDSATLTICKIQEEDVGDYQLKLKNDLGETLTEIKIVIVRK